MEGRSDLKTRSDLNQRTSLVILNFSGVYETQEFYKKYEYIWLDNADIPGTNCYCDEDAEKEIRKRIRGMGPGGIHFLDSGNYHYVSKIWLEMVEGDFELLVFDHHTDMQMPMFGDILSCGGWIRKALDSNPGLKRVWLAGPPQEAAGGSEVQEYGSRVVWIGEEMLGKRDAFRAYLNQSALPLYISVDKDVLDPFWARTNWDQGNAGLTDIVDCLRDACSLRDVIGVDICGENPEEMGEDAGEGRDDWSNGEILGALLTYF